MPLMSSAFWMAARIVAAPGVFGMSSLRRCSPAGRARPRRLTALARRVRLGQVRWVRPARLGMPSPLMLAGDIIGELAPMAGIIDAPGPR